MPTFMGEDDHYRQNCIQCLPNYCDGGEICYPIWAELRCWWGQNRTKQKKKKLKRGLARSFLIQ